MSFNGDYSVLTLTDIDESHIGNYSITITASDGISDTADATSVLELRVMSSTAPSVNETGAHFQTTADTTETKILSRDSFSWPNGYEGTITISSMTPTGPTVTFDQSAFELTFSSVSSDIGTYTVELLADDGNPSTSNTTNSFTLGNLCNFLYFRGYC